MKDAEKTKEALMQEIAELRRSLSKSQASGVYLISLRTDSYEETAKTIMLK